MKLLLYFLLATNDITIGIIRWSFSDVSLWNSGKCRKCTQPSCPLVVSNGISFTPPPVVRGSCVAHLIWTFQRSPVFELGRLTVARSQTWRFLTLACTKQNVRRSDQKAGREAQLPFCCNAACVWRRPASAGAGSPSGSRLPGVTVRFLAFGCFCRCQLCAVV